MRRVSPAFAERALDGRMQYRNPEYLHRATVFLRVAAGHEAQSAGKQCDEK